MRLAMTWSDASRRFTVALAPGSRMRPPARRPIDLRLAGQTRSQRVEFDGSPLDIRL
jgi:hypothetical protein